MLFSEIEKRAAVIAQAPKTNISFLRQPNESKPALTDKKLQQSINSAAQSLGFTTKFMQSGAGHDSKSGICETRWSDRLCGQQMAMGGFRHVPVIQEDGTPLSIILIKDVLGYLARREKSK